MKRWRIMQSYRGIESLYHVFRRDLPIQSMMAEVDRLQRIFPGHKFRLAQ